MCLLYLSRVTEYSRVNMLCKSTLKRQETVIPQIWLEDKKIGIEYAVTFSTSIALVDVVPLIETKKKKAY